MREDLLLAVLVEDHAFGAGFPEGWSPDIIYYQNLLIPTKLVVVFNLQAGTPGKGYCCGI